MMVWPSELILCKATVFTPQQIDALSRMMKSVLDERLAQAGAMLAALDPNTPTILAGDFNSRPDSPVMALVAETFHDVDKGSDRLTFDSVDPRVEIDYVLVRPLGRFRGLELDVLDEPLASDHRPLVLRAQLR